MNSIAEAIAKFLDLVSFIWKRKAAKNDNPENKILKAKAEIEHEIKTDDIDATNARLSESLTRLGMRDKS